MSRCHRAMVGILAASALSIPMMAAVAAPAKKAAKKAPAKGGDAKAGQAAFKSEGCTGCHKTKDYTTGGEVGPDLSKVAESKKATELSAYIQHPKAGSVMPAFKGPKKTLDNLVAYLMTQK